MSEASGVGPALEDEAERKRKRREIRQASQRRIQKDKNGIGSEIAALKAKIAAKKEESGSLEGERNMKSFKQVKLKNKRVELQQGVDELKNQLKGQNEDLERLSKLLIDELKNRPNGQNKELEAWPEHSPLAGNVGFDTSIVGLRNEVMVHRQIDWNEWASEKAELQMEIDELRMKNSTLNTTMQVLRGKMIHM